MNRLEQISHLSIIAISFAGLYLIVEQRVTAARAHQPTRAELVGKRIGLRDLPHSSAPNVVVAMTSECPYCLLSLPFYRKLSQLRQKGDSAPTFTVLSPEPADKMRQFLADYGITPDNVLQSPLPPLGIGTTPTILVLDAGGTVQRMFRGRLPDYAEQELLQIFGVTAG